MYYTGGKLPVNISYAETFKMLELVLNPVFKKILNKISNLIWIGSLLISHNLK